jgi:hypothetical protein
LDAGHDATRDWLKRTLERWTGQTILTEQRVPQWDRIRRVRGEPAMVQERTPDGQLLFTADGSRKMVPDWERARLDVSFMDADGRLTHVDVSFASAATIQVDEIRLRGDPARAGRAASQREDDKRRRYRPADNPSEPLVVFAVESRGRLGAGAVQLLRSLAPTDETRGAELSRAYRELSVITQRRRAHLLRAAEGGRLGLEARGARFAGRR